MKRETVTSATNPKIRNLLLLQEKSKARREQGLFVVEGRRELEHCLDGGFRVRTVFVCPEIAGPAEQAFLSALLCDPCAVGKKAPAGARPYPGFCDSKNVEGEKAAGDSRGRSPLKIAEGGTGSETVSPSRLGDCLLIEIPEVLYRKVAYRDSTEGIIAEVECKQLSLEQLRLPEHPLIVVLESVEKPGNLGAVLRSADAAGADAVLVCDPLTDLYNPNLIRASIGAVFTVPTVLVSSAEAIPWLKARGIRILTAQLQDSSLYYDTDMRCGTALVMGTEATGLTQPWRGAADAHIRIPMLGRLDSLNVSVSTAILLFEAVRQRQ